MLLSQLQPQAVVAQAVACLVVYLVVADVAMLLQPQPQAAVAQTVACLVVYLVVVDVAMLLQTAVACLAD